MDKRSVPAKAAVNDSWKKKIGVESNFFLTFAIARTRYASRVNGMNQRLSVTREAIVSALNSTG
jgi:hypothetical protein